jgi:ABC-type branched-subunit amino acid transport system substrate-binding protein
MCEQENQNDIGFSGPNNLIQQLQAYNPQVIYLFMPYPLAKELLSQAMQENMTYPNSTIVWMLSDSAVDSLYTNGIH